MPQDLSRSRKDSQEEIFLLCFDDKECEVYIPVDVRGTFYALSSEINTECKNVLLSMSDICTHFRFPCVVKLIYGNAPKMSTPFSGFLLLQEMKKRTSVIGCTMSKRNNHILDIPAKWSGKLLTAITTRDLLSCVAYRTAENFCRKKAIIYMRNTMICNDLDLIKNVCNSVTGRSFTQNVTKENVKVSDENAIECRISNDQFPFVLVDQGVFQPPELDAKINPFSGSTSFENLSNQVVMRDKCVSRIVSAEQHPNNADKEMSSPDFASSIRHCQKQYVHHESLPSDDFSKNLYIEMDNNIKSECENQTNFARANNYNIQASTVTQVSNVEYNVLDDSMRKKLLDDSDTNEYVFENNPIADIRQPNVNDDAFIRDNSKNIDLTNSILSSSSCSRIPTNSGTRISKCNPKNASYENPTYNLLSIKESTVENAAVFTPEVDIYPRTRLSLNSTAIDKRLLNYSNETLAVNDQIIQHIEPYNVLPFTSVNTTESLTEGYGQTEQTKNISFDQSRSCNNRNYGNCDDIHVHPARQLCQLSTMHNNGMPMIALHSQQTSVFEDNDSSNLDTVEKRLPNTGEEYLMDDAGSTRLCDLPPIPHIMTEENQNSWLMSKIDQRSSVVNRLTSNMPNIDLSLSGNTSNIIHENDDRGSVCTNSKDNFFLLTKNQEPGESTDDFVTTSKCNVKEKTDMNSFFLPRSLSTLGQKNNRLSISDLSSGVCSEDDIPLGATYSNYQSDSFTPFLTTLDCPQRVRKFSKPVHQMSFVELCDAFRTIKISPKVIETFQEEYIDGELLSSFSEKELKEALPDCRILDLKKISQFVKGWRPIEWRITQVVHACLLCKWRYLILLDFCQF